MSSMTITGVILAGGRASRMGGMDKGLVRVGGRTMVEHVMQRLAPQTTSIVINANRNHATYAALGVPVVSDRSTDYAGPLAGMAAAMEHVDRGWIVTVPCDSPLVPPDLVERLRRPLDAEAAEIVVAEGAGRLQPVFALLSCALLPSLQAYLDRGERKIDRWYAQHTMAVANMDDLPDTFLNINTPEERDALEARYFSVAPENGSDECR